MCFSITAWSLIQKLLHQPWKLRGETKRTISQRSSTEGHVGTTDIDTGNSTSESRYKYFPFPSLNLRSPEPVLHVTEHGAIRHKQQGKMCPHLDPCPCYRHLSPTMTARQPHEGKALLTKTQPHEPWQNNNCFMNLGRNRGYVYRPSREPSNLLFLFLLPSFVSSDSAIHTGR